MPDSGGRSLSARPAYDQKLDPGYSGTCRDPSNIRRMFAHRHVGGKPSRDGFARDCPPRHSVPPVLALRDRSRAHGRFLVGCGEISVFGGRGAGNRDAPRGEVVFRWAGDRLACRVSWSGLGVRTCHRRVPARDVPAELTTRSIIAGSPVRALKRPTERRKARGG